MMRKEYFLLIIIQRIWIIQGRNNALCILTVQPENETIKFAEELSKTGEENDFDVYMIIDDENFHFISSNIHLLNISREECYSHGYSQTTNYGLKPTHVVAWDKSLYYFSQQNFNYSFVWLTESDVFIPSIQSFHSLYQLYSHNSDLIISKNLVNRLANTSFWRWRQAVGKIIPPWSASMVNTVGLSRRMLQSIADYIQWHGVSIFHEYFFLSLAIQLKMIIRTPLELSTLVYRQNISWKQIEKQPNNFWHPMKNSSQRQIWRDKLMRRNQKQKWNSYRNDLNNLRYVNNIIENLENFLEKFEIEKCFFSVNDRHYLHQYFLELVQYYQMNKYPIKAIMIARKLADHAYKTPEAIIKPLIPNNSYYKKLEKELEKNRKLIINLLSNKSNHLLIKQLRQRANFLIEEITLEIQREVKIQQINETDQSLNEICSNIFFNNSIKSNTMNESTTIDCIQVTLTRSPLHGFGIAINCDQQCLIISDVIQNGPADGKLLPNDRIINVNGHPVVRTMEYESMKLIRDSTDFVHLIVQRRCQSKIVSNKTSIRKCILTKTQRDEKFQLIIDCQYFIKKLPLNINSSFVNIHEGDEIIQINDIPVNRLTLIDAQKLINQCKKQIILYTKPKKNLSTNFKQEEFVRLKSGFRYISFLPDKLSIGIRLAGGNKYGLFICEIQSNSAAEKSGLFIADKIFNVNKIDFTCLTREEAVLYLTNMKTSKINMIVSNCPYEYEQLLADIGGDSFYIRTHFACPSNDDGQLSIDINDIFHITDTLSNGQVGYWTATKMKSQLTGIIPNQIRAEELIKGAPNLGDLIKSKEMSLRKKLKSRSKSFLSLTYFKDDSIFNKIPCWKSMINSKYLTYERVHLKLMTIIRPVVILGSLADIARDRLLNQYSDQFELPEIHLQSPGRSYTNIIKLQSIKNIIDKNRHCVLDITPSAIEQLNYAECYPIVIYLKISERRLLKQIREEYGKFYSKSIRRLFENAENIEYSYSYLFTSILNIDSNNNDNWFDLLKSQINFEQEQPIWMSNDQINKKDLLKSDEYFLSTNCFNDYSQLKTNSLHRVASDPSIFHPSMQISTMSLPNRIRDFSNNDEIYHADRYMTIDHPKISSTVSLNSSRRSVIPTKLSSNDRLSSSDSNTSIQQKNSLKIKTNQNLINHSQINDNQQKSIEKPRVFTYDDRNILNHQSLSSSSNSSALSLKDKIIKEVGETQSYSIQDGCHVIGSARGIIDYYGGKLSCPLTGVSLFIPMGAISQGIQQEIFFEVCQKQSNLNKFDQQFLSPIVICGPQGIHFNKPIELILPYHAENDIQQLSLMFHRTNSHHIQKEFSNQIHRINKSNVAIYIDHF